MCDGAGCESEKIREAVDLRLFRKRMWVKSMIQRGSRLVTIAKVVFFFFFFLIVHVLQLDGACVGALEVLLLCTYFKSC